MSASHGSKLLKGPFALRASTYRLGDDFVGALVVVDVCVVFVVLVVVVVVVVVLLLIVLSSSPVPMTSTLGPMKLGL